MTNPQQSHSALSPTSTANSLSQQLAQRTLLLSTPQSANGFDNAQLVQSDRSLTITYSRATGAFKRCLPRNRKLENKIDIDYRNILNCQLNHQDQLTHTLTLSFINSFQDQNFKLKTLTLTGNIEDSSDTSQKDAQNWVENLLLRSYEFKAVPRSRRVLIIINPQSGSKKSVKIWSSVVEPILKASTATYEVIFTTHSGHAGELGEKLDLDSVDVLSCVSGDGLVHEVLNGLGRRKSDFAVAMEKLALTSIPCGSGNALSTNHLGPKHAKNICLATLNVLKGTPVRLDLCSSTQLSDEAQQGQKSSEPIRKLSLLSTSFGIMAELDVGTEHLRRLGSIRFVLGYLWGAIRNQQRRIRLDVQLVEKDKQEIRRTFEAQRQSLSQQTADPKYVPIHSGHSSFEADSNGLPPLKYGDITTDIDSAEESNSDHPWTTIETDIISFYAGILPFMSQELLLFPAKVPGHDGTIDITLHHSDSVWKTLACLVGAETGGLFKNKDCEFMKVKAFRLTFDPEEKPRSYVVVDGEDLPYRSIQVEIHERAFQSLSLNTNTGPYFGSIGVPDQIL
ncbi:hypothetical protein PCANC_03509 [Puccinia coronata f. sp. avenae]|uniref:DAGKc domain-containing protein n=1 Tax=Puccinia coronata f. sp. avenae TaxID=200324 RepID=A0A2N5SWG3_9BASI|nr:hypothetical protein PCANC_13762 [Puccinia coronata f. sp. avenae]PLW47050.1 hypothetical protein PCASD_03930 [Puccinia coronata f. sp. avenae]PLW55626.1 hypothetical protein PCANC_03509 [Puccinia coronata f. sp. avenae]